MSTKPPSRFNLLPILLGIVVLLVGAGWWKISQKDSSIQAHMAAEERQKRAQEEAIKAALLRGQVCQAYKRLEPIYGKWSEAFLVAMTTPIHRLSGPINKLINIYDEASDLAGPPPRQGRTEDLLMGMQEAIAGFYEGRDIASAGKIHFDRGEQLFLAYISDAERCPG